MIKRNNLSPLKLRRAERGQIREFRNWSDESFNTGCHLDSRTRALF